MALAASSTISRHGVVEPSSTTISSKSFDVCASRLSTLTTGGIRGGKVRLEKFTPRTFNMGFTRDVYNCVGGFREMFSEDIDMSKRIARAGFRTILIQGVLRSSSARVAK